MLLEKKPASRHLDLEEWDIIASKTEGKIKAVVVAVHNPGQPEAVVKMIAFESTGLREIARRGENLLPADSCVYAPRFPDPEYFQD